jgi:hypothetical protein
MPPARQRPSYWVDIVRFRYRPLTLACNASRMARISNIPRTVSGGGCLSNAAIAALASSGVKSRIHRKSRISRSAL